MSNDDLQCNNVCVLRIHGQIKGRLTADILQRFIHISFHKLVYHPGIQYLLEVLSRLTGCIPYPRQCVMVNLDLNLQHRLELHSRTEIQQAQGDSKVTNRNNKMAANNTGDNIHFQQQYEADMWSLYAN